MSMKARGEGQEVTTMQAVAPRRGRPPLEWLEWSAIMELPAGTAVLIDRGQHELRTLGRVASRRGGRLVVHRRDGALETFERTDLYRARVIDGLFEAGDPVLLRNVPARRWRGGVVQTSGQRVFVETTDGTRWMEERELEHADDRTEAERAARPTYKPGPIAADPVAEVANQHAWTEG